jgi:hypothetical protein
MNKNFLSDILADDIYIYSCEKLFLSNKSGLLTPYPFPNVRVTKKWNQINETQLVKFSNKK